VSLRANNLIGFSGGFKVQPFAHLWSDSDDSFVSTFTFSSKNLGDPAATRHIVIAAQANNGTGVPLFGTITIAGVSATIHIQQDDTSSGDRHVSCVASAIVPAGTTGDIVVSTDTGAFSDCAIDAWRCVRRNQIITPLDSDGANGADPVSLSGFNAGHYAVGAHVNNEPGTAVAWTGMTEVSDVGLGTGRHSNAWVLDGGSSLTVSVNHGGDTSQCSLAVCSWLY